LPSISQSLNTFNSSTLGKMAPKLPRRHAQRQALCHRNKTSVGNLRNQEQRQRHKPQNTKNQRGVGFDRDNGSGSESDSEVDVDFDIDREEEKDSGYGSNTDDEAEYLNELVEQFREMGPQISNLGDVALRMIQTEHRMFQQ
jgi:hypothetical protein